MKIESLFEQLVVDCKEPIRLKSMQTSCTTDKLGYLK